jgi:hypothetical protein
MVVQTRYRWQVLAFFSLLSAGWGLSYLVHADPKTGITPEAALVEANGKLAWMNENKYGTRFGLVGVTEQFEYPSKAGDMGAVRISLRQSGNEIVSVRYEIRTHGPIYSDDAYHDVWELTVGDRGIRTYGETSAAWEADNRIGPWFGLVLVASGIFLGYVSRQTYRAAKVKRTQRCDGASVSH